MNTKKKPYLTRDRAAEMIKDPANWEVIDESVMHKVRMLMFEWRGQVWVKFQRQANTNYYMAGRNPQYEPTVEWSDLHGIYEWDQHLGCTVQSISMTELANTIYLADRTI